MNLYIYNPYCNVTELEQFAKRKQITVTRNEKLAETYQQRLKAVP